MLLFGEPKREIEEVGETEEVVEDPEQPLHVKDSRPVEERDGGWPPQPTRPKDRAQRRMDRHVLRVLRWSHKDHRMTPYSRDDRLPHYMLHIRFGPGRFKDWWVDAVTSIRACLSPTVTFFPADGRRKRLIS
ncbi:hypothetical protein L1987_20726 [Smallanthus sonchifolius]|uniref:Uncharacterized protein n=1 Tax=Smallanthus sonchifolius TaxID=185202 RepID=A0ACB9ISD7_9ASTR|nr:hypothetical protein L1987_20726 [Smallanthus sonchifolius]